MLWSLIAVALAAEPTLVLPADQDPGDWRAAAALTGFRIGAAGSGREIELRREGGGWVLIARDGRGLERRTGIAAPGTVRSREDAMWLGASLLASLPAPPGGSSLSMALPSGKVGAGSVAAPASSAGGLQGARAPSPGAPQTSTGRSGPAPSSMGSNPGSTGAVAAPPRSAAKRPAPGSVSPASSVSTAKGRAPASAATGAASSNAERSRGEERPTGAPSTGATQPASAPRRTERPSAALGKTPPPPGEASPPLSKNPGDIGRSGSAEGSAAPGTPGSTADERLPSPVLAPTPPALDAAAPSVGRPLPENGVATAPIGAAAPAAEERARAGIPSTVLDATVPSTSNPQPENGVATALPGEPTTPTDEPPRAGIPSTALNATPPSPKRPRATKRIRSSVTPDTVAPPAPAPGSPTDATAATDTAGAEAAAGGMMSPLDTPTEESAVSASPAPSTAPPSPKGLTLGAWVGVAGALELRSGLPGGAGGALEAGLHLSPSLWLGAAWRWIEPRTIPAIEGAAVEPTRDLSLGLFWSPERPVAPWLGAGLGSSARGYTQGARTVADLRLPVASAEVGLRFDLDPRWSIGLVARGAQDLDVTEVIYGSRAPQTLPGWAVDLRSALRATFP